MTTAANVVPSINVKVKKRTGLIVDFDRSKIVKAISGAFREWIENSKSLATVEQYYNIINNITDNVTNVVVGRYNKNHIDIEAIQDIVETQLMSKGHYDIARLYIVYREKHKDLRKSRLKPNNNAIIDYVRIAKYSQYRDDLKRREVFSEVIDRNEKMNIERFPNIKKELDFAYSMVRKNRVFPSMRSFQYAGKAIEKNNVRIYNCAFSICNNIKFFQESFFMLLCGTGVGYSVQESHVECLPVLALKINNDNVVHHTVKDSIEGWADALGKLIHSYVKGYYVEFDYSKIREKGSLLKTAGGRAPGHLPLKKALDNVRAIIHKALGRKLRPIECHDIQCFTAEAAIAGGNRESAMIALFSIDDLEMLSAKTGNWCETNLQRKYANNSVVVYRKTATWQQFKRLFQRAKEFGEPGIFFSDVEDCGTNPCCEIGLYPVYHVKDDADADRINMLYGTNVKAGEKHYGVAFCNLSEINASKFDSPEDMYEAARAASILGTVQASYTDFPYLGWATQEIVRREALLGVSMTGIMGKPGISLNQEYQRKAAQIVIDTNKEIAAKIGINSAARSTCVKPSGSTSIGFSTDDLMLSSGIHDYHARRFFRRVKANKIHPVYNYFKTINPGMVEPNNELNDNLIMCVEAPEGAIVRNDTTAIGFLERVKLTQTNWVMPGTAIPDSAPGVYHNVSNTCSVKETEWDEVASYIWKNREFFTGISLLPFIDDGAYKNPPFQEVKTPEDEVKWNRICSSYKEVDYTKMVELFDDTDLSGESACVGGKCSA